MNRYRSYRVRICLIIAAAFILSVDGEKPCPPPRPHQEDHRPLTQIELIKIAQDIERIINKNPPSYCDYIYLDRADEAQASETSAGEIYCNQVLKLDYETPECSQSLTLKRSIYLLNLKNLLSDGKSTPIKIYVRSKTTSCTSIGEDRYIYTIAVTDDNKFKYLKMIVDCDSYETFNWSMIKEYEIDGKLAGSYPFTITQPLPPLE